MDKAVAAYNVAGLPLSDGKRFKFKDTFLAWGTEVCSQDDGVGAGQLEDHHDGCQRRLLDGGEGSAHGNHGIGAGPGDAVAEEPGGGLVKDRPGAGANDEARKKV